MWFFDEIHKYRRWRDFLKGLFDGRPEGQRILVTGSAKLESSRYSGDSLQGRYHLLRLHPLSVAELGVENREGFDQLMQLGGFPEPFFSGSEAQSRRWSREYCSLLVREEITALEQVRDLGTLELFMLRLPGVVGSPLSLDALRKNLQVSHKAVAHWMAALERLYAVFRLAPFGSPRIRALTRAQKHYHFDWSVVPERGPRFENVVASHLLKWVQHRQDALGVDLELCYFRDRDGREVDFVVTEQSHPLLAVECKLSAAAPSRSLRYWKKKFPDCATWQLTTRPDTNFVTPSGIRVTSAWKFLKALV